MRIIPTDVRTVVKPNFTLRLSERAKMPLNPTAVSKKAPIRAKYNIPLLRSNGAHTSPREPKKPAVVTITDIVEMISSEAPESAPTIITARQPNAVEMPAGADFAKTLFRKSVRTLSLFGSRARTNDGIPIANAQ